MSKPMEIETAEYELLISPSAGETNLPKPASTNVHADFSAVSHTGRVRARNEDHFLVSRFSRKHEILQTNLPQDSLPEQTGDDGYLFIVADGMGGMAAGEVASRLAISTSLKLFHRSEKWGFKVNQHEARELVDRINSDLQEIDKALTEQSAADRRLLGMGTTLTAAYSMGVDLFIVHLGDSRVYLYRDGTIRQLTKDHTVAQAMADAGHISHEAVRHHVKRNALTNFLGGHNGKVRAEFRWLRLADGDRLLLCSDGLNEMVDDASIARIIGRRTSVRETAQSLLDEALNCGGKDNVTIIVAGYQISKPEIVSEATLLEEPTKLESTSDSEYPSLAFLDDMQD
jgi:serine/threonine protein phosphatase PrpC